MSNVVIEDLDKFFSPTNCEPSTTMPGRVKVRFYVDLNDPEKAKAFLAAWEVLEGPLPVIPVEGETPAETPATPKLLVSKRAKRRTKKQVAKAKYNRLYHQQHKTERRIQRQVNLGCVPNLVEK